VSKYKMSYKYADQLRLRAQMTQMANCSIRNQPTIHIRMLKSRMMRRAGLVMRNIYSISDRKYEGKRPLEYIETDRKIILKWILKKQI
jgi:hypothetical protein